MGKGAGSTLPWRQRIYIGLGVGAVWLGITPHPLGLGTPRWGNGEGTGGVAQTGEGAAEVRECIDRLMRTEKATVTASLRRQRMVRDADVEDVVHESILRVCMADTRASYQSVGGVLQKAATRRAVDYYRRRGRECSLDALPPTCTAREDDARWSDEAALIERALCEETSATQDAIGRWSRGERDVEIGRALGMDARQVKDARNNAIKRIRKKLDAACGEEKKH